MTNVGAVAANLHEGSRSEYLAHYIFASFGTAIPVPHHEDTGVDIYCTLTERLGALAWPRYHYTVQVKSTMSPWQFGTPEAVRWLVQHPLPLFLCVVDKSTTRVRLYHTFPRFLLWVQGALPDTLQLVPKDPGEGQCTQWEGGSTFSLGPPILDWSVLELLEDTVFAQAKAVLEFWLQAEGSNLANVTMGVPIFAMPATYKTNTTDHDGWAWQGGAPPEGLDSVRATLGKMLPWLADAFRRQNDMRGMTRTALLLRYLYPKYEGPGTPHAPFVEDALSRALSLEPRYAFEGVDLVARHLDSFLDKAAPLS